jgi:hypothetical protein
VLRHIAHVRATRGAGHELASVLSDLTEKPLRERVASAEWIIEGRVTESRKADPKNSPIYYSKDGGSTWSLLDIIGGRPVRDQTLRFADSSGMLYAGVLWRTGSNIANINFDILRTNDFSGATLMTKLASRKNVSRSCKRRRCRSDRAPARTGSTLEATTMLRRMSRRRSIIHAMPRRQLRRRPLWLSQRGRWRATIHRRGRRFMRAAQCTLLRDRRRDSRCRNREGRQLGIGAVAVPGAH